MPHNKIPASRQVLQCVVMLALLLTLVSCKGSSADANSTSAAAPVPASVVGGADASSPLPASCSPGAVPP